MAIETRTHEPTVDYSLPFWKRKTVLHRIDMAVILILLIPVAIATILPLVYMFSQAFTPEDQVRNWPVEYIPREPTLASFQLLVTWPNLPIMRWMLNSFIVSTSVTALVLTINSLTAYAFGRLEFPGRDFLFIFVLTTLMIPGEVTLIPTFVIMRRLEWLDTYNALIWPAGAGVFGIFLLRQFFQSIPRELEDAAIIDGCGKFGTYWRIVLPLSRSALIALGIFTFLGSWNDLFWPLIALNSNEMRTLPVGLSILQHEGYTMQGLGMAAAALTTVPVLILYGIFQRHIIQGVMVTGLTGGLPSAIDRGPDPADSGPFKSCSRVPGRAKPQDPMRWVWHRDGVVGIAPNTGPFTDCYPPGLLGARPRSSCVWVKRCSIPFPSPSDCGCVACSGNRS